VCSSDLVIVPVVKKNKRSFRGSVYRNRISSRGKKNSKKRKQRSIMQDVVVVAYPLSFKAKPKPLSKAIMWQEDAEFRPNVLPITRGTRVKFINKDRFYHNVFSYTRGAKFNIGRRRTNTVISQTIRKSGKIKLFCDIHSQMNATIISLDTPYFTQPNKNGVYLLKNLPAGKYRLVFMHPNMPDFDLETSLKRGESQEQSVTLTQ